MHRAMRLMFGTVGIGLLAAFLVLGLTGSTVFQSGPASPARDGGTSLATLSAPAAPAAPVHPDAPGNYTTLWVNITSVPSAYSALPTSVGLTIQVTVSNNTFVVGPGNTNGTLWLINELTEKPLVSWAIPIQTGVSAYTLPLDSTTLGCSAANCTATLGNVAYNFYLYVATDATGDNGTATNTSFAEFDSVAFITYAPVFGGVGGTIAPAGNINVSVYYHSQYVSLVTLNIYNSASTLVYSSNFVNNATTGAPQVKVWFEGTTGTYLTSVVGSTPYQTFYSNSSITVAAPSPTQGGTVYYNTTIYNNVTGSSSPTGYFGLSPAASGTLFLLIGLIVGILVALVAARMMMSEPPNKPAQPWSDNKGDAANTCSVCGKSFGSADELAAHAKSEHGMQ